MEDIYNSAGNYYYGKQCGLTEIDFCYRFNVRKYLVANHYCPVKNKLTSKFMMNAAFDVCKKHISYEQALM